MKAPTLIAVGTLLAGVAFADTERSSTEDDARVLDEVETTETQQTSGRDRMKGAGEELAANEDRSWREQITCKTRPVTGSRIVRERTCRTNAQWQAEQQDNQRSIRNLSMGQSGSNN